MMDRYDVSMCIEWREATYEMVKEPDGDWCGYEDVEKLQAENDQMTSKLEKYEKALKTIRLGAYPWKDWQLVAIEALNERGLEKI